MLIMGIALLGMYARGLLEAMDIIFAARGWMGVIDGLVSYQSETPVSVRFRVLSTGVVAPWGMLGMTVEKYF